MNDAEVLLRCTGLAKSYGGVKAVADVSLQVRAGEIVGLVGPNGAGKTTVVDLIVGTQQCDGGEIRVRDRRLSGPPSKRARAGLARTFQHPQLALELTVWENLLVGAGGRNLSTLPRMLAAMAFGMIAPGLPAQIAATVRTVAADLGVSGLDRLCADLTLGEQRLVEVARAVLREPSVILLDEPFAGSDSRGVEGITVALRDLVRRGCGVLVVDHNVDIIAALVDRIALMDRGRVLFDGPPAECMNSAEMQAVYFGTAVPTGGCTAGHEEQAGHEEKGGRDD